MDSIDYSVPRELDIELPKRQSAFLWGPRKTGKSTWLKEKFAGSIYYDLLKTDVFIRLMKEPWLLREDLLAKNERELSRPIILDEVQKVPQVLDEIHWLIENRGLRFVMCGSSARKLKRGQANLLGGRAWRLAMFPLTWKELPTLELVRALGAGLLPPHYFSGSPGLSIKAYVEDYLREEIKAEGLVRSLPSFARFLDALGYSHGELTNYANIARDCGVDAKTVRSYYEILNDTMLGRFVPPFVPKSGRQMITSAEKFYLCDVGVAGHLCGRTVAGEKGEAFGRAFEHFVLMELWAHSSYSKADYEVRFWRTKTGHEVDFVLGEGKVAVEVKGVSRVDSGMLKSLKVFVEEHKPRHAIVVCNEHTARQHGGITILPWRVFFERLWEGKVV